MRWWPFSRGAAPAPTLQSGGGDPVLEELANHLVLAAFGDGEIADSLLIGANQRDTFIAYGPLARATTIITSAIALIVCEGGLAVRDRNDRTVDNRRTRTLIDLLSDSPDGVESGFTFIEDCIADYCLDANTLIVPMTRPDGSVYELVRYRPHSAYTTRPGGDRGPLMYHAQRAFARSGELEMIAARNVIHVRWPQLRRGWLGEHQREHFATPNVTLLSTALGIGLYQDKATGRWYRKGPRPGVHFNFESKDGAATLGPEQIRQLAERLRHDVRQREDLYVTRDAKGAVLDTTPKDKENREYQVQEVARFYGLPLPLFSTPIGQWTRGINEQVMKMAWRTGIRPHLGRFLGAMSRRLLLRGERFVPDPAELVRGDAEGIAALTTAWSGDAQRDPIASRRELRHAGGLPREPDGEIESTRTSTPTGEGGMNDAS